MEYRQLGNSNIRVSVICLGTMTYGQQNSEAEGHAQLDQAMAAGVNFLDTAEMYPFPTGPEVSGRTEEIIGSWLQRRQKRDDVVIATKIVGPSDQPQDNSPPPLEWIRSGQTRHNRTNIAAAIDGSLRRLQTDYIDLYQLHWPDRNTNYFGAANYIHKEEERLTPFAETLAALGEFVQAGKIRHIGLSNETPWGLAECLRLAQQEGMPRVVSVQNPYNLLNRTYEIGMAEISAREKCGLLPYSPLAFGVLSGKYMNNNRPAGARLTIYPAFRRYLSEKANAAVADYAELAASYGWDMAQLAIAFSIQQPFVTSSIIGATTPEQLKTCIDAADLPIDDGLRTDLNELGYKHFNPCP